MARPPAPTLIRCRHGKELRDGPAEPYICSCCGSEHRSAIQLCLACREIGKK